MTTQAVNKRTRNWTFILYPESAPADWEEVINDLHIPWAYSPLHDKDTDIGGHPLKPHYHCILQYSNQKAYRQVLSLTKRLLASNPQQCESVQGFVRYLAHLDEKWKYLYDVNDIKSFCGFDVDKYLQATTKDRNETLAAIRAYIIKHNISEISTLYAYTDKHKPDWSRIINNNIMQINTFIFSIRYKNK